MEEVQFCFIWKYSFKQRQGKLHGRGVSSEQKMEAEVSEPCGYLGEGEVQV